MRDVYVMLSRRHHVASHRISLFRFFQYKAGQENESIIRVRIGQKNRSLAITFCPHSASLVMPIGDPRAGFFYPTLTLRMDSYLLHVSFLIVL